MNAENHQGVLALNNSPEGLTLQVEGHPTEFGVSREFNVYVKGPSSGNDENTGILLIVHNRSEEASHPYYRELRREWADRYNLMVVGVDYLGTLSASHPKINVEIPLPLIKFFLSLVPKNLQEECVHGEQYDIQKILSFIDGQDSLKFQSPAIITNEVLTEQDYWDFGFVQSLDMLFAYRILIELCQQNNIPFNEQRSYVYGFGSAGHIAQMCGRFAPYTFALIIDYAGKVMAYPKEMVSLDTRFFRTGFLPDFNIKTNIIYVELYSLNKESKYYLTPDMIQIRNLARNLPVNSPTKYLMFSNSEDLHSKESARNFLANTMQEAGMIVEHINVDQDDDQGLMKNVYDVKKLFEQFCDDLIKPTGDTRTIRNGESDFAMGTQFSYETTHGRYIIDYSGFVPTVRFEGEIVKLTPDDIV